MGIWENNIFHLPISIHFYVSIVQKIWPIQFIASYKPLNFI